MWDRKRKIAIGLENENGYGLVSESHPTKVYMDSNPIKTLQNPIVHIIP